MDMQIKIFAIGLCVSLTFSCCSTVLVDSEDAGKSKQFKKKLIESFETAERIDLVEHSCALDYFSVPGIDLDNAPTAEYKRVTLTREQQEQFSKAFRAMSDAPKDMFSGCIFEPHHSIEFHFPDGSKSVIEICFKCGDTIWQGTSGLLEPKKFQSTFAALMTPLGFQRERDWKALAKDHVGQE